ncbi:MAG: FtsX-like permease family protein [Candidatus Lokiarchaeota archaeon]|nr:FtsX-like permease family protein [Candidatus Lokiarchaeota archaeon]MBD3198569.1 FtsX-like permease family protein [Candidatus Lokiarchaeota archaeon]
MNIREIIYRLKMRFSFYVLKQSWLDMKRDKAKIFFGVSGIAISLFLLTAIGMINNTISYNYIEVATNSAGSSDIIISRTIQADLTYDPYFDEQILDNTLKDIKGVEKFFPRITMLVETSSDTSNITSNIQMYGIDFIGEHQNTNMGELRIVDENGVETGAIYSDEPRSGECVILQNVAEIFNLSRGDTIYLSYQQYNLNLEVVEICVQHQKFTEFENTLVLLNIDEAQTFLNKEGKINFVYGTIENPELIYDSSDLDATTQKLRVIGTRIQERLDLNEYSVTLPKLEELNQGEFLLISATIVFWFIIILSMLITGILINSILSTSVEERIREFGIMRVVGGKKVFPIKIVIFEGLLLGLIGTVLGIILGIFITEPISRAFLSVYDFGVDEVTFVVQPDTLIIAFVIGLVVSLIVSLIPGYKASKKDLIKSITPFQSKEEGWEIAKEGSMKVKAILIGLSISTIGLIIFILLPIILVSGSLMLTASLFIGLLAAILLGLVFTSVGVIPYIERIFLALIYPFIKKYYHVVKISLKRYQRRNTSTVVMFAISFSFIFFVTSLAEMEKTNTSNTLKFQYGSDLVLLNDGGNDIDTALNLEMVDEIRDMNNVRNLAVTLHNTIDIQRALAVAYDFSEGSSIMDESSTQDLFMSLFGFYASDERIKPIVHASDIPNHDEVEAGFIGINENFLNSIDKNLIIWSSPGSNNEYSFNEILTKNNTCIISKAIADALSIGGIGEQIRLTFFDPQDENDPGNVTLFTVAGISGGIPGFWNFRSSSLAANGGGVMVSKQTYQRLMKIKNPDEPEMIVDKVFINLNRISEAEVNDFKDDIRTLYDERDFVIDDAATKIKFVEQASEQQSALLELVLMFTVIISIFGLISSMYSIIMERKFEIGILRSMGLKVKNVRNMFLVESMILLLASGIMGTFIGTFSAYLMQTNTSLLTEQPVYFVIPFDTLTRVFLISVVIGIVGMFIILLKLNRQSIMDIFRQTF